VPDSVVLIADGRLWTRSAAALRIARRLSFPWPLLYVFVVVPRPLRDWIYDLVARHRYQWFGRRDACMMPTAELRGRFIDAG
jgi:predicted DCC family thiol-disulfide oxidoreductase YuxK